MILQFEIPLSNQIANAQSVESPAMLQLLGLIEAISHTEKGLTVIISAEIQALAIALGAR